MLELIISALLCATGVALLAWAWKKIATARGVLYEAQQVKEQIKKDLETERRESLIKLKDELYKRRTEAEAEIKKERNDLERFQQKLTSRLETLEKKESQLDEMQRDLQQKERNMLRSSDQLRAHEQRVKHLHDELISKLEAVASMSREEARQVLVNALESDVRMTHEKWIQKVEDDTRQQAKERSIQIVVNAMQRYAAEQVAPNSSGVVHLPNDEMKGRIIGKEGRNIKSLEMATGMEFVIGETPEIITISGFNPIRREVARRSLEKLISDGRINPTRIEETVLQCEREIDEMIEEYGKNAIMKFNLQGVKPEITSMLGKLHFRTSFSQNVLLHSFEVALFARVIAEELGLPHPQIALRGGLLHDIGKALSAECEGPHAMLGAEVARRCGEDPLVINAIAAHHEEVPFASIYAPIVMIADSISASRPGARRETLSTYIKRLEKLETIAHMFEGVKKAYALQAGREVRIIVEEDNVNDEKAIILARDIATTIEKEMAFPGQIKVNVIREKRAIEYAR
jgi:ribonuclease Y